MLELRRPGQTVVTLGMATYLAEGTVIGPTADGNTSASHGTWIRITDGKFLQTVYIFVSDHVKMYFLDVGRPSRISAEWVMYQSSGWTYRRRDKCRPLGTASRVPVSLRSRS